MSFIFIVLIVLIVIILFGLDRLHLASIFLKVYRIFNCKNI